MLTIVHLSDLHFAKSANRLPSPFESKSLGEVAFRLGQWELPNVALPASHDVAAARALSSVCRRLAAKNDSVVFAVSGDLAATGRRSDLVEARTFLSGANVNRLPRSAFKPCLYLKDNLVLVPGNHDRYEDYLAKPNCKNFDTVFSGPWSPSSPCSRVMAYGPFGSAPGVVFISGDFSLERSSDALGIGGRWGQGYVYEDRLSSLVDATAKWMSQGSVVVWVVHFPPFFEGVQDELRLLEEDRLVRAAAESNVRLILSGHTHQSRLYEIASRSGTWVSCAGSATGASLERTFEFSAIHLGCQTDGLASMNVDFYRYEERERFEFIVHDSRRVEF